MAGRCSICEAGQYRDLVERLAAGGASLEILKKELADRGTSLPTVALKRHLKNHCPQIDLSRLHPSILQIQKPSEQRQAEYREECRRQEEAEFVLTTMVEADSVNLQDFLNRLNISEIPQAIEDVVGADQAISYGLFLRAAAIADKELELYARDRERYRYPATQLKGLASLHEMMASAFAYRETVSINAAAATIKREGGRVLFEADEPNAIGENS